MWMNEFTYVCLYASACVFAIVVGYVCVHHPVDERLKQTYVQIPIIDIVLAKWCPINPLMASNDYNLW